MNKILITLTLLLLSAPMIAAGMLNSGLLTAQSKVSLKKSA
jgi:hypothetical protein